MIAREPRAMPAPLDLDQLRTFVAIAETGSFTRARDVVLKTQSAAWTALKAMGARTPTPISALERRNSRLTEEGERPLGYASRMVRLSEATLAAFGETELQGTVRLGTPDDY